jgi:lysozyme family protein
MSYTFEVLKAEYEQLLATVQVTNAAAVIEGANRVMANISRYKLVTNASPNNPPAAFIGALDLRESSCNPTRGLGQGDRWDQVSVNEPKGCGPFASWAEAARFYIHYDKLDTMPTAQWTMAYACFRGEAWNGWGPRQYHGIRSGYLWGGTNHQQRGKYVSDGQWDGSVMDQQVGIVPVMLECIRRDPTLAFGVTQAQPNVGSNVALPPPKAVLAVIPHDFGQEVKRTMLALKYPWFPDQNVVSAEGRDPDGKPNKNRDNAFDDVKMVLNGEGKIIGGPWEATTQPGVYWTKHPMAEGGAFIIALGPQTCWERGDYHGPAWRQKENSTIMGHRDPKGTFKRQGPPVKHGNIGVHHHKGYDLNRDDIANAAAGCQVIRSNAEHLQFVHITEGCQRFMRDGLTATVLTSAQIEDANKVTTTQTKTAAVVVAAGTAATAAVADKHWDWMMYVGVGMAVLILAVALYFGIKWWRHRS